MHQRVLDTHPDITPPLDQIAELVRGIDPLLPAALVRSTAQSVRARMTGLGPLEPLLADPQVTDVLINGPGLVWVERAGSLEPSDVRLDRASLDLLIERMVAPLGRRVDPTSPVVDGRLPDGSRVHVVVPPVAVDGPCVTIRRFVTKGVDLVDIAGPQVADLLRWAVRARSNIVVVGGTGSGKTTLLNALAASIPSGERVVTVEDAAELRLPFDHVVRLESRPASVEGPAAIDSRDLVRSALRMRPDRLIVGEVRDGAALDMVQAMNTGHDGSLSTLHANGCNDALHRLETLVLLAGVGLPHLAVRDHLRAAVDLIVHIARDAAGRRRVTEVAEVVGSGATEGGAGGVRTVAVDGSLVATPVRQVRDPSAGAPSPPSPSPSPSPPAEQRSER